MTTDVTDDVQVIIERIKKKSNLAKWAAGITGSVLIVFAVWTILYAVLGLLALGASLATAAIAGAAFINWWPGYLERLQTRKIERVIQRARQSPIPTMWDEHSKDVAEADQFETSIVEYDTEINNCINKRKQLAPNLTESDLVEFDGEIAEMQRDLALQEADLAQVRDDIAKQEVAIKRFSALWDLAQARNKANEKNVGARREDEISRLRKDSAMDSVTDALNSSKAKMRARINARRKFTTGSPAVLENNPSEVIEVSATIVRTQDSFSEKVNAR